MRIGFDAKRFYHNHTGLGNYSRTLVSGLQRYAPGYELFLYNTKAAINITTPQGATEVLPPSQMPAAWWRSFAQVRQWSRQGLDVYHGLSNELPLASFPTGIKTVVTVHDIIYERYPHHYGRYETLMHRAKIKNACRRADVVIAISAQTKADLLEFYKVPEEKIKVCYQSCNEAFYAPSDAQQMEELKKVFKLPREFFLYVGSITERKNLLRIVQAMGQEKRLQWPLVVIGKGKKYFNQVQAFLQQHQLQDRVKFLSYEEVQPPLSLNKPQVLAALYHCAAALVYPSLFEGWGIPVLEAHAAGLPVITSQLSSMPEISGDAALYVNPFNVDTIADAMLRVQNEPTLRSRMILQGTEQAKLFTLEACTLPVASVYQSLVR